MKILYNIHPLGISEKDFIEFKNIGYCTIAVCESSLFVKQLLTYYFKKLLEKYSLTVWASGEEERLKTFIKEIPTKPVIEFPSLSKLLSRSLFGEVCVTACTLEDLKIIASYWDQCLGFELYLCNEAQNEYLLEQIRQTAYKHNKVIGLKYAEISFVQSGDEDQIEITFNKSEFELIVSILDDFREKLLLGNF